MVVFCRISNFLSPQPPNLLIARIKFLKRFPQGSCPIYCFKATSSEPQLFKLVFLLCSVIGFQNVAISFISMSGIISPSLLPCISLSICFENLLVHRINLFYLIPFVALFSCLEFCIIIKLKLLGEIKCWSFIGNEGLQSCKNEILEICIQLISPTFTSLLYELDSSTKYRSRL